MMSARKPQPNSAFKSIQAINYTVIFARDMDAMRAFYEGIMRFEMTRELSPNWLEYTIGSNTLALARPGFNASDLPVPNGSASVQLAFRVSAHEVDQCAAELAEHQVEILSPPTDRDFGHRTLFFRDPDGNLLEMYAEI